MCLLKDVFDGYSLPSVPDLSVFTVSVNKFVSWFRFQRFIVLQWTEFTLLWFTHTALHLAHGSKESSVLLTLPDTVAYVRYPADLRKTVKINVEW